MNDKTASNVTAFDRGYKWLHWTMAFLVLLMMFALVGFAQPMTEEERITMLIGHSSIGTIICLLLFVRVFKRFIKKDSVPVQNISELHRTVSKFVQFSLYAFMALVPLSGYLTARLHELPVNVFASFNLSQASMAGYEQALFETVKQFHVFAIYTLLTLIVVHIGGAVYHKFIKKDDVVASMTTKSSKTKA